VQRKVRTVLRTPPGGVVLGEEGGSAHIGKAKKGKGRQKRLIQAEGVEGAQVSSFLLGGISEDPGQRKGVQDPAGPRTVGRGKRPGKKTCVSDPGKAIGRTLESLASAESD